MDKGPTKWLSIPSKPSSLAAITVKEFLYTLYSMPASLSFFLSSVSSSTVNP
jgi:hypothetical protein